MKDGKMIKIIILVFIIAICIVGYSTIGNIRSKETININIKTEENHLEEWQSSLPKNIEEGELNSNSIRGMIIKRDGETVFAVSYEPKEYKDTFDYWDISFPYKSLVSVDTEELYSLFNTVTLASWKEVTDIDLEEAGIKDEKNSIFVAYDSNQKEDEIGHVDPTESKTILIGKEDGEGNYFVSLDSSDRLFKVSKNIIDEILNIDPYDYILKIPTLVSLNYIDELKIIVEDDEHILKIDEDNFKINSKSIKKDKFKEYYSDIIGVILTGEISDNLKLEENREPALSIQFYRKSYNASDIEIIYYPYDENNMSVSVNGQEKFLVGNENIQYLLNKIKEEF